MNRKEIVNKYIYLINQLFIGKEVIVYYDWKKSHHEQKTYSLWMGLENYDISLNSPFLLDTITSNFSKSITL
jgi:hypothetical protein